MAMRDGRPEFRGEHRVDPETGLLNGGQLQGTGVSLVWAVDPDEISGAGPLTLIVASIERLEALQKTIYRSDYHEAALVKLREALAYLDQRTKDRQYRGVHQTAKP